MWKPLLISALSHLYLLCLGDRASQTYYCAPHSGGARLGKNCAVEEAFPTVLRRGILREGSFGSMEEHHGNRGQVPLPYFLIQPSPRVSMLLRKYSRLYIFNYIYYFHIYIYIGQVHTEANT